MKNKPGKLLPAILLSIVAVIVVAIGMSYFNFVSRKIYEDSTEHLKEIYSQVNHSFGAFIEQNWGLLHSWGNYLALTPDDESAGAYIEQVQEYWGFSQFRFLAGGGDWVSPDGTEGTMGYDESLRQYVEQNEAVMGGDRLPDGQEVTFFAVPVTPGTYRGFDYGAIAVTYTNAALASSLNVEAFSGQAKCFVIHDDGSVLLSTQAGQNIYGNYLTYLQGVSDLDAQRLAQIRADWERGESGLLQCTIADDRQCILYQPMGYQDYTMLSIVPQSVMSAGFLSVQKTTIGVFVTICFLIAAVIIAVLQHRGRKRTQMSQIELKYRDLMFDALSKNVNDIFLMLNIENKNADYISPNVERLLGIPQEQAKRDLRVMEKCAINGDVFIPKQELLSIPLDGSVYRECEYRHQTTGERRWYRMTVYHVGFQEFSKFIIIMSDRTQERQMNEQMQEALDTARSANEAKSNFLSNMSHDIRTPMNAIVGFSMLLEKNAEDPNKVREYTRKIATSSHHLLSLINDVLDMSKIESGKTSLNADRFSLPELLEDLNVILMPQIKAKGHEFQMHVRGKLPEQVIGDKMRLNQILLNLMSNAIKYTPPGGRIEFLLNVLPQTGQQFVKLQFLVRDNGVGMSEEFQKQVFHPFSREINSVTNKIQGTGLGMAITENLVTLMGGAISVQSAPGAGSTFTVELSFALPEQDGNEEAWFHGKVTRVLVADDEEEICQNVRELLHDSGVEVHIATDGGTAVQMAVQAHGRGEDYSVILLDWKMPHMDGVEAARRIRQQVQSGVPILVLTSYDWAEIEDEARQAGINAFLAKPFFVSSFWQVLKPLFLNGAEQQPDEEAPKTSVLTGRRFLVAEDNELNAEILLEMLHMEGAEGDLTVNGKEALEAFLASAPGQYDMVLMDVQMPVMDGYEATRQIRRCGHPSAKTIPIVAMTANTFTEDIRESINAGMNGHLAKPINMEQMRSLLGRIFRGDTEE